VKTLRAGKDLTCAAVICKVWELAMALKLSVITSCVLKWSINSISDPKPCQELPYTRDSMYECSVTVWHIIIILILTLY
jgi:hypothetical protein